MREYCRALVFAGPPDEVITDLFDAEAESAEDFGGEATAFQQKPEEQMFGADLLVVQQASSAVNISTRSHSMLRGTSVDIGIFPRTEL